MAFVIYMFLRLRCWKRILTIKSYFFFNFDNKLRNVNWKLNTNCFEIKFIKISINDTNPKWPLNLTITWCPQSLFLVSYVVWNDLWVYIILFQYVAFVTNCLFFTLYQFDKKKTKLSATESKIVLFQRDT